METTTASEPVSAPQKNTVLAVLAYLGILVIVAYLVGKDDPFVKFHVKQGLVLLVIEIAIWIVFSTVWMLWFLWQLVNLVILVLAVIGIINAVQGKQKDLPLVGQFARYFAF